MGAYQFSGENNGAADETFIAEQLDTSKVFLLPISKLNYCMLKVACDQEFFEKFFATEVWYSFVEEHKKHGDDLFEDFINFRGAFEQSGA